MIKLINLLKEIDGEDNIIEDAKILSQDEFLEKYSDKTHGYVSIDDKGEPFIRINDEIIPVTPSEDWHQYKKDYDTLYPILLKYTREYDDAQVQDGHHRVKYIMDKDISGELGYILDDESLNDLWEKFN